jgi:tetratricopeptide (TPR) repeat protein
MKNVFAILLVTVVIGLQFPVCFAQNVNLNSAIAYYDDYVKGYGSDLPTAKTKIDLAAENESTSGKYKTWFYKGSIYLALFDQQLKAEMNKSTEADINKKIVIAYNVIPMENVDIALKAFQKEIELDDKKIYTEEASGKLRVIASNYSDKGYASLVNSNYADAIAYYEKSVEMKSKMGITDTAAINNMAISAVKMKDYKKAEGYYGKLIDLKYKPERNYFAMIQMYTDAGDTAAVRNMVTKGAAAMPESYALLIEKINLLLRDGKSEAAISSINQALAKNPNNHELHLVLGQTYNKMAFPKDAANKDLKRPANFGDLVKKAEAEFSKAIEIKPDYTVGLYSIGVFYNNLGADILKQSESIKDPKAAKVEEDKADVLFKKAIPLLEKAHELDPGDKDTMRTLRQLYARTGQGDSEKYKKLNEELKK